MKDMQEGEGIDIAQKYNVQFYPTYLFINHDGSLYCRMDGGAVSKPEDNFVQKVKNAIELTELNKEYAEGNREQAFLKYNYFAKTGKTKTTNRSGRNDAPTGSQKTMRSRKLVPH